MASATIEQQFVHAEGAPHECVYLPHQIAKLSYVYPRMPISETQMDLQLAKGQRRSGPFLYWMNCQSCKACEPTRVLVDEFRWTTSMRRVLKRAAAHVRCEFGPAQLDTQHVDLYNLHRLQRGLGDEGSIAGIMEYREFLIESCCTTMEQRYFIDDNMIGATIVDVGRESMSAVYTFFDPAQSRFSIGTYAVLKLIEHATKQKMRYVYLGLYVAQNAHLKYKARFAPQERLIQGRWIRFEEPSEEWQGSVQNKTLHSREPGS